MKPGDTVIIVAEPDQRGIIRKEIEIDIGRGYGDAYQIVTFPGGHEGAYGKDELQVVESGA